MSNFYIGNGVTPEDSIVKMQKTLDWLLRKLDHNNVKRLYTEYCSIRSKDGETQIIGPTIKYYDKQTPPVLRKMSGYDPANGDFIDRMWDKRGQITVDVDGTTGEAIYKGNIITTKNAFVGNSIYIGTPSSFANKGVFYYDSTTGNPSNDIGLFLTQYDAGPTDYKLVLSNYVNLLHVASQVRIFVGDNADSAGIGLNIDVTNKCFVLGSYDNTSTDASNITHYGSGNLYIEQLGTGGVVLNGKLAFFNGTPVTRTAVTGPSSIVTTETAGSTYTSNEVNMLTHLKTDVSNLRSKLSSLITALGSTKLNLV